MILGRIIGKVTTRSFSFRIDKPAKILQYVQAMHREYGYILAQIMEITQEKEQVASCNILGYNENGKTVMPRMPLAPGTEVLSADEVFIAKVLSPEQKNSAYIGTLENTSIKIFLDLNKLLTKHIAIIAKTGAGKSYTAGVLIEEIMDRKVPLLIIDPHGEYSSMRNPSESAAEKKGYASSIQEYLGEKKLRLNEKMSAQEIMHILPSKLSPSQTAELYSRIKDMPEVSLSGLIDALDQDSQASSLSAILDYLKSLELFSADFTPYDELVKPGKCTIINLRGTAPEVQEIIVYKLLKDLFEQRKLGNIAPFFSVIEEAHNFAPERSFGEAKSSQVIRTIASEGRKFGLGLCTVTQRPARLDKNVLSQCSTHIILKVTNPSDLKSISSSVENITPETEEEIKSLEVGKALVAGIVDNPLIVKIRERKSMHGGATVDKLKETGSIISGESEILPLVLPRTTEKDIRLMEGKDKVSPILIPAFLATSGKYSFLIERIKCCLVKSIDSKETFEIFDYSSLHPNEKSAFDAMARQGELNILKINEKTAIPILRLKEIVEFFHKQGLILKKGSNFILSDKARLVAKPADYQSFYQIQFKQISYEKKLSAAISADEVKKRLSFFPSVELKECYIVYFKR